MIKHKRVLRTDSEFYIFYPFGFYLSKGFVTLQADEIEKAIAREKRLTLYGLPLLLGLYVKFYNNKDLWVGGFYIILLICVISALYISARTSFKNPEVYNQEKHGNLA